MRKLMMMVAALVVVGCNAVTEPGTTPAYREFAGDNELVDGEARVTYILTGDAFCADIAFYSNMGPRDTIPGVLLPLMAEFIVPAGEEMFIRATNSDPAHPNTSVSVLVINNGMILADDTVIGVGETAEARGVVW